MIQDMLVRSVSFKALSVVCERRYRDASKVWREYTLTATLVELGGAVFSPDSVIPGATHKMVGSVMFFQADTIEEVKKTVESDIYYTSGVVSLVISEPSWSRKQPCGELK